MLKHWRKAPLESRMAALTTGAYVLGFISPMRTQYLKKTTQQQPLLLLGSLVCCYLAYREWNREWNDNAKS